MDGEPGMNVNVEDLDALKAALVKGEREVSINDKRIVYRSTSELLEAIHEIEMRLMRANAKRGRIAPVARQIRMNTSKGF
jgi:hypothetical protein